MDAHRTAPNPIHSTATEDLKRPRHSRALPIGAEVVPGGGVHFRVWAPQTDQLLLELRSDPAAPPTENYPLEPEGQGYFSGLVPQARAGMCYSFRIGDRAYPDPASRFQPQGPHGPSQIIDPGLHRWNDQAWRGVPRTGQVIYELHVGTFTKEGTWAAAEKQLPELKALGVTLIEMMPVAEFPGDFGWGYDGVDLFAPTRLYGMPDDLRHFVDMAHQLGLGVILDVVYNHFGPDGNYLNQFSEDYFTDRYSNEWGRAINFDGENSGPVREFFLTNSTYWIQEFHFDGLRLDATQQIFDASECHILEELSRAVRKAGVSRATYLVSENETQHARLVRPFERGGYGMEALWNDDFHHAARVALTGKNEAYYSDYRGTPQEFISALKWGFLYQGQWYSWQKKHRGTPARDLSPEQFVTFLENHDQVANSLRGLRLHQLTSPGKLRAMTALLLLGTGTPMLFQGQEFAATTPFLFFADHHAELARLVAKGRKEFLHQFSSIATPEAEQFVADPGSRETFLRCKLDFSERETHSGLYELHRDLLRLRREDPVFSKPRPGGLDGAVLGQEAFALRFAGEADNDRLMLVNLGVDLKLSSAPEPLLAPAEGCSWEVLWSSEAPRYGGFGIVTPEFDGAWLVPGHATLVLKPGPQ